MSNMNFVKKSSGVRSAKAGVLVSLAFCVLALCIGSYSAIDRVNELDKEPSSAALTAIDAARNQTSEVKYPASTSAVTTKTRVKTEKRSKKPVASFFTIPVGGEIIKGFDAEKLQYSETYGDWRLHTGIDIAAKNDTRVHAAGDGTVTRVYEDEVYGTTVIIEHGNGIACYYSGVAGVLVKAGDAVEVGGAIGIIGDVPGESVESLHIHFAATRDGEYIDPIKDLNIKLR